MATTTCAPSSPMRRFLLAFLMRTLGGLWQTAHIHTEQHVFQIDCLWGIVLRAKPWLPDSNAAASPLVRLAAARYHVFIRHLEEPDLISRCDDAWNCRRGDEMETALIEPTLSSPQPPREDQKRPRVSDGYDFYAELAFTATYQKFMSVDPAVREGMCLKIQTPHILGAIEETDLVAGRIEPRLVGFSPDEWGSTAFGYYALPGKIDEALHRSNLAPSARREVENMRDFWDRENTSAKVRRAYPPELSKWLFSDDWMGEPGVAFPLYRLTGGTVRYERLLQFGIPGLYEALNTRPESKLYAGMRLALEALEDACRQYEVEARSAALSAEDDRRTELTRMADALAAITVRPPQSFVEAVQLFWIYSIVGDIRNHGRMDVYLGDFLTSDIDSGSLSEDEALRILQSLWSLMASRNTRVHNRVIIGGVGRRNEASADRFAVLAMEATRTVLEAEPQLSLRFYDGMDDRLLRNAYDVIGEGRTFPMLYNDEVNVPAVMKAFGVNREAAEQYVPFGCGEYIIEGQSFGTPSGVINLMKALEVTLNNGRDLLTERQIGLALGELADFRTFDQLWSAYAAQVEHFVRLLAEQEKIEYDVAGQQASFLLLSLLYDDCVERDRAIFSGGIRHLGGTLETYGNTNAADSLTAIRKVLFEDRSVMPEALASALKTNFEGRSDVRQLLRRAPKYGNDDDAADEMLLRVHDHVCTAVRNQASRVGLDSYLVVIINNSANTLVGRHTAASPDGRLARTPLNNGNSPSSGNDRKGVTAFLNSVVKPSPTIHAGAVQNMKFSREVIVGHRAEFEALLDVYFAKGGPQAMITVVSRRDLEDAMREPANFAHIFVRVGGFSARFIDLPRDVQLEIFDRTLY